MCVQILLLAFEKKKKAISICSNFLRLCGGTSKKKIKERADDV
jgi:hypothetical protein